MIAVLSLYNYIVPTESPTGPPIIGPPLILVKQPLPGGGVLLAWEPPQTDSKLLGYKINYGNTQDPPTMVARESTHIKTAYFWVRPDIFLEYGEEVMVVVWAYSLHDEGEGLSVVVYAVKRECRVGDLGLFVHTRLLLN